MKQFNGYDNAKVLAENEKLPIGGYILEIKNAEVVTTEYGDRLVFNFDIAEGEFKDFYANNYRNQQSEDKKWKGSYRINVPKDDGTEDDERTKSRFKTAMSLIEDSNKGFTWAWDETKLKGKKVGGIFRNKEYSFNDRNGFFTECAWFTTVAKIKDGKFKIPADRLLTATAKKTIDILVENDVSDLPF